MWVGESFAHIFDELSYFKGKTFSFGVPFLIVIYLFQNNLSSGMFGADRLPNCQHVASLHARIGQVPTIAAWIEKRPVTPY